MLDALKIIGAVVGVVGVGGFVALLFFWPAVAAAIINTRAGRAVAALALFLIALFWIVQASRRKGAEAERAKREAQKMRNIQTRIETDETIRDMPHADRRKRLERWVRE